MGKAADNEQIKLRATAYNNIAVGLALGGVLLPYLSLILKGDEFLAWFWSVMNGASTISATEIEKIILVLFAFVLAFWGAVHYRRLAKREIEKITD
jgi:hypothetical protein